MAAAAGISHKTILPVAGKPMILRVTEALQASPAIDRIAVCIEAPDVVRDLLPPGAELLAAASGPAASVAEALSRLGTPLLVTTADHALLKPEWIRDFTEGAQDADLAIGIATKDVVRRDVPDTKRTWIRFADMTFSGCNLFLFRTPASAGAVRLWQTIEAERKHPLRMAWLLTVRLRGPGLLLRWLTGRLTAAAFCGYIERYTGASVRFVPLADGRACVDVDKPADLELTERLLAEMG
ncbi:NTP transferase domain-containing protein [Acetobacter sp. AN02]|uniref:NTP transferase domain-containing protein n=1 Tax=Acetobacter sp. AN02 TaxID=2894186 RepID=UPI00243C50F7|nr:NTP transferase domain-containing protein [Acetobacter sp. AN02]